MQDKTIMTRIKKRLAAAKRIRNVANDLRTEDKRWPSTDLPLAYAMAEIIEGIAVLLEELP